MPVQLFRDPSAKQAFGGIHGFLMMQHASRLIAVCKTFDHPFSNGRFEGRQTLEFAGQRIPQPVGTPIAEEVHAAPNRAAEVAQPNTNNMSLLTAKGNWNIARGKLKQRLAQLVNDDLEFIDGKEDELVGRIQTRAGRFKERSRRALDDCCRCNH